jgi:hypothetical protein
MKALEKDPADRFDSADEMRGALEASAGRSSVTTAIPRPAPAHRASSDTHAGSSSDTRWIVKVILAVAAVVAVALVASSLSDGTDEPERRPPTDRAGGGRQDARIEIDRVADFDPYGGDGEHPEEAPLAGDGDASTSWTTQTYSADLATLGKPGVGLTFELGADIEVSAVTVKGSAGMDIEIRAGDSCSGDETSFEEVASQRGFSGQAELTFEETSAGCWLVWITRLSADGGGQASIAEVEFRGN